MSKLEAPGRSASAEGRASVRRHASGTNASLALCAALLAAGPAFGHAKLLDSSPAPGTEITGSPPSLTLTFNENVRLGVLKLTTAGHAVPLVIDPNPAPSRVITIKPPALTDGAYDLQWSAMTPSGGLVGEGAHS